MIIFSSFPKDCLPSALWDNTNHPITAARPYHARLRHRWGWGGGSRVTWSGYPPPWTEGQTRLKTLPSFAQRTWSVINHDNLILLLCKTWSHYKDGLRENLSNFTFLEFPGCGYVEHKLTWFLFCNCHKPTTLYNNSLHLWEMTWWTEFVKFLKKKYWSYWVVTKWCILTFRTEMSKGGDLLFSMAHVYCFLNLS